MVTRVKAAGFAILMLLTLDVAAYHGAGTRRFLNGIYAFGQGIGAWVFYS